MTGKIKKYQNDFIKFLRSTDFSKAIVLTIAIVVPIGIFSNLGNLEIGISLAMGCLLSSPSDVPGSFKHKVYGILKNGLFQRNLFSMPGSQTYPRWAVKPY